MEKIKESMSAAAEALQEVYENVERLEKEMESNEAVETTELFEPMKVETMLTLLKDGSIDAMNYARPHLIEFLEDYLEQKYIEDERLGKLEDNVPCGSWCYDDGELYCGHCGAINFDGDLANTCPHCGVEMIGNIEVAEKIIIEGNKSAALCRLCAYGDNCCHLGQKCENCEQGTHCCNNESADYMCCCDMVNMGQFCRYFKRRGECKCHCCG